MVSSIGVERRCRAAAKTSASYLTFWPIFSTLGVFEQRLQPFEDDAERQLVRHEAAAEHVGCRRSRGRSGCRRRGRAGWRARCRRSRPASASRLVVSVSIATRARLARRGDPLVEPLDGAARCRSARVEQGVSRASAMIFCGAAPAGCASPARTAAIGRACCGTPRSNADAAVLGTASLAAQPGRLARRGFARLRAAGELRTSAVSARLPDRSAGSGSMRVRRRARRLRRRAWSAW